MGSFSREMLGFFVANFAVFRLIPHNKPSFKSTFTYLFLTLQIRRKYLQRVDKIDYLLFFGRNSFDIVQDIKGSNQKEQHHYFRVIKRKELSNKSPTKPQHFLPFLDEILTVLHMQLLGKHVFCLIELFFHVVFFSFQFLVHLLKILGFFWFLGHFFFWVCWNFYIF